MEGRGLTANDTPADLPLLISAAFCGVVLFSATIVIVSVPPVTAWWFTPAFAMPLVVALAFQKRTGWWGVTAFLIGFTLAHCAAAEVAYRIYAYDGCAFSRDPQCSTYALSQRAFPAGFIAGWVGAALSFTMVAALDPRFRTLRNISIMGFAALILGGIGSFGFSFGPLPHRQFPTETVLLLYLPWQTVFAGVLIWLFSGVGATSPLSPHRAA
ncbi:MAG: hypothetical protein GC166_01270 [Alphaproteobacteria bacterium]|nr:hypothetical protein [Alphaproteobacteria bacterium]